MRFGPQLCGDLDAASAREWLVADGVGGFAMGTVSGLRTRRYHGLLVVATAPPGGRMLGLAALDPVLVLGDRRVRLAIHEWATGAVDQANVSARSPTSAASAVGSNVEPATICAVCVRDPSAPRW